MKILAVGRLKSGPEAELLQRYVARIRPALSVIDVPDGRGPPDEAKRREAKALLAGIAAYDFVVALDQDGQALDSEGFARQLEHWLAEGRPPLFVIGGAEGLDKSLIARANASLSFGRLTWPHALARVMLAEQIFRARSIVAGHPYHRRGRP